VADVAVLVGVVWPLKLREYEEKYVFNGQTHELALQPGRTQAGKRLVTFPGSVPGRRRQPSVGVLPDRGRLVLMVFGDGQGEGGGVDLKVESVGRLDGVAVALDRLGAVAADLHLGLHRATDLVGGFKAWARVGLPVQPAELA
jgi:hypothetical protein